MKFCLFFLLNFITFSYSFAQDKDLNVVATAGSTFVANNISLDWTLGEVIIQTLDNPSVIVTQGFHQPLYSLVAIHTIPEDKGVISVLPNPFSNALEIKMIFKNLENGTVQLFTANGNLLFTRSFKGKNVLEKFNTSGLPSGPYVLAVSLSDNSFIQSYTIFKNQ